MESQLKKFQRQETKPKDLQGNVYNQKRHVQRTKRGMFKEQKAASRKYPKT